jgi:hypothetical protein
MYSKPWLGGGPNANCLYGKCVDQNGREILIRTFNEVDERLKIGTNLVYHSNYHYHFSAARKQKKVWVNNYEN